MVLRGATSLRGALEGVGTENRDFFGPWNGTSEASAIWAPSIDVAPLKAIMYMRHKNNWYIGSFMYPSAVVYCCCVLLCVVEWCCVLVRGVGGLLVAVLCEQVGAGWQASPSPTHYSVGILDACWWVGGCYSYIRFDPSLAVSWLAHTTHMHIFHGPVVERPHFIRGGTGVCSIPGKDIMFKLEEVLVHNVIHHTCKTQLIL